MAETKGEGKLWFCAAAAVRTRPGNVDYQLFPFAVRARNLYEARGTSTGACA